YRQVQPMRVKEKNGMPSSTKSAHDVSLSSANRAHCRQAPSEGAGYSTLDISLPTAEIEHEMATARPRLLRLARAHGLPLDTAHEVVQETLLEAWRHLGALSDPAGFQAWLNAICRNVCRRYGRAHQALAQREVPLGDPRLYEDGDGSDNSYPQEV